MNCCTKSVQKRREVKNCSKRDHKWKIVQKLFKKRLEVINCTKKLFKKIGNEILYEMCSKEIGSEKCTKSCL